ncbi:MAG: NUDIX domain-containing protein [Candidatus Cybelea sp.]
MRHDDATAKRTSATHLATGILVNDGRLLMVASRYANHPQPLWNLPGGRQLAGELLEETVVREVFEETGLRVNTGELAYVSESYDGEQHFLNVAFRVILRQPQDGTLAPARSAVLSEASFDAESKDQDDRVEDHVVKVEWVPLDEVGERIVVAVVREPLLEYLRGSLEKRYAGFHDAGVTIEWPPDSR